MYRSNAHFWATFFRGTSNTYINFDKKLIGLHFGRLFHKLIWSPCSLPSSNLKSRFWWQLSTCPSGEGLRVGGAEHRLAPAEAAADHQVPKNHFLILARKQHAAGFSSIFPRKVIFR
jgi:hypothetical protein